MAVSTIVTQPDAGSINAAYTPIRFTVTAPGTPPVVYCDVYFNGVYYKSFLKTQNEGTSGGNSTWQFFIEDTAQEYLKSTLPANGGSAIVNDSASVVSVQCKFRDSAIDGNGFTVPQATIPIQGTGSTAPVSGSGLASNTFFVLNAALQHEDNPELAAHLDNFKVGTWEPDCYPLSHKPEFTDVTINDSDYFPAALQTLAPHHLRLKYIYQGQTTERSTIAPINNTSAAGVTNVYIPTGPKNLRKLFAVPDFLDVDSYYIQVEEASNTVMATTPRYKMALACEDDIRINFVNYLGMVESIRFQLSGIDSEHKSDSFITPAIYPFAKSTHRAGRFNIVAGETYTARTSAFTEDQLPYLQELFNSPKAWLQWAGIQGQPDSYLPIVILDTKAEPLKEANRFVYDVQIQFRMSVEKITLRN